MNNIIIITDKETFNTNIFYYNKDEHILNYSILTDSFSEYRTIPNVECDIEYGGVFIYVHVKPYKG